MTDKCYIFNKINSQMIFFANSIYHEKGTKRKYAGSNYSQRSQEATMRFFVSSFSYLMDLTVC